MVEECIEVMIIMYLLTYHVVFTHFHDTFTLLNISRSEAEKCSALKEKKKS